MERNRKGETVNNRSKEIFKRRQCEGEGKKEGGRTIKREEEERDGTTEKQKHRKKNTERNQREGQTER